MAYLEDPIPGKPIKEVREELAQIYEHEEALPEVFAGHAIHLFMHNHQWYDCSYGEEGFWNKRNPERRTAKWTLWLRLDKEFLRDEPRIYEPDWTHATVTDEPNDERHRVAHAWIDSRDARYKDLIADMWKDLRLRLRLPFRKNRRRPDNH
jgi:hypothetical protein